MSDSATPYDLTFEVREHYLYVCVKAPSIDRESALAYLTEIAQRRASVKSRRLMIVRDIPVMLSDSDLFFTTRDFLEMIGTTKVAFVNPHASIEDGMNFAMTIGINRGANYHLFGNTDSAERWLLKDIDSGTFTARKER